MGLIISILSFGIGVGVGVVTLILCLLAAGLTKIQGIDFFNDEDWFEEQEEEMTEEAEESRKEGTEEKSEDQSKQQEPNNNVHPNDDDDVNFVNDKQNPFDESLQLRKPRAAGEEINISYPQTWEGSPKLEQPEFEMIVSQYPCLLQGNMEIQLGGKVRIKQRAACELYGTWLCAFVEESAHVEIYDLRGCQIRATKRYQDAMELVNPRAAFRVGHFSLFLLFSSEQKQKEWETVLLDQGLTLCSTSYHEILAERLKKQELAGRQVSCEWINQLLARWMRSMTASPRFISIIREKLAAKIASKLAEKGFEDKFADLRLVDMTVSEAAPRLGPINIHPLGALGPGSVSFDLGFAYHGEVFFSITTKFFSLPCQASVLLTSLSGRLLIHAEPATQLWSLSFFEFPTLKWEVKKKVKKQSLDFFDLQDLIEVKLRITLEERFVLPNRRYARIPKTPKTYWELKEVAERFQGRLNIHYLQDQPSPSRPSPSPASSSDPSSPLPPSSAAAFAAALSSEPLLKKKKKMRLRATKD